MTKLKLTSDINITFIWILYQRCAITEPKETPVIYKVTTMGNSTQMDRIYAEWLLEKKEESKKAD